MGVNKWLWDKIGPTKEPRWLVYLCAGGLLVVVLYNVVLVP